MVEIVGGTANAGVNTTISKSRKYLTALKVMMGKEKPLNRVNDLLFESHFQHHRTVQIEAEILYSGFLQKLLKIGSHLPFLVAHNTAHAQRHPI